MPNTSSWKNKNTVWFSISQSFGLEKCCQANQAERAAQASVAGGLGHIT